MRTLVVFYSRSGTTKKVAKEISKILKCDTEELVDLKSRKGFKGFLNSGRESHTRTCTKLGKLKKDPSKYDLIILGTPTWTLRMSCPMRTYILKNRKKFKKIACFMTYGGLGGLVNREMAHLCGKKAIAGISLKQLDVKTGRASKTIRRFCQKIKKNS